MSDKSSAVDHYYESVRLVIGGARMLADFLDERNDGWANSEQLSATVACIEMAYDIWFEARGSLCKPDVGTVACKEPEGN